MKNRKCICSVAVGIALTLLVGCSVNDSDARPCVPTATVQPTQSTGEQPASIHTGTMEFPTEYRITYERENGDGTLALITLAKDQQGNFYYSDAAQELWYLADGDGYLAAEPDMAGRLVATSPHTLWKESAVLRQAEAFMELAESSGKQYVPGFTLSGTATVAGRNCDLYTNTMGIAGLNVIYQLYIDQETGICLGWIEKKETSHFDSEASEGTFLCVEFETEINNLPGVQP